MEHARSNLAEFSATMRSGSSGIGLSGKIGIGIGSVSFKAESYSTTLSNVGGIFALDFAASPNIRSILRWNGGDVQINAAEFVGAELAVYNYDKQYYYNI